MQLFIDTLINSAMASSASALVVVGLALIFGVMRVENFAHGELYMVGAYATWFVGMSLGWGYWAGFLAAIAVTAVIGDDTKLGEVGPQRVGELRALADQQGAGPMNG